MSLAQVTKSRETTYTANEAMDVLQDGMDWQYIIKHWIKQRS